MMVDSTLSRCQLMLSTNVNTHLKRFPVLDTAGRAIEVGEGTADWVVLVSSRLRDQEPQIRAFFQGIRTGDGGMIRHQLGLDPTATPKGS